MKAHKGQVGGAKCSCQLQWSFYCDCPARNSFNLKIRMHTSMGKEKCMDGHLNCIILEGHHIFSLALNQGCHCTGYFAFRVFSL